MLSGRTAGLGVSSMIDTWIMSAGEAKQSSKPVHHWNRGGSHRHVIGLMPSWDRDSTVVNWIACNRGPSSD